MNGRHLTDRLYEITFWQRVIYSIKSLGFIGGAVGILFAPILLLVHFIWNDNNFVLLAGFIFVLGLAVLLNQSGFRMLCLLRNISKAEKSGLVNTRLGNSARAIIVSRRLGQKVDVIELNFQQFFEFSQKNKALTPAQLRSVRQAWYYF